MRKTKGNTGPNSHRLTVSIPVPFDCFIQEAKSPPKELWLLLHGYADLGQRMFEKIREFAGADVVVVAPNGPFLLPYKKGEIWKTTFSWYFFDQTTRSYHVSMEASMAFLRGGFEQMGYLSVPKRIVGFSQGGFLAPFASLAVENVKQIIGIGCNYLWEELTGRGLVLESQCRIDGIHGRSDEVCPIEKARSSFEKLKDWGNQGEFYEAPHSMHVLSDEILIILRDLLKK